PPAPVAARARTGASILLVEDEPSVRYVMRRTLEEAGYTVHDAGTMDEALALLAQGKSVSLLLTDVILPGGGGRELADRVAEQRPGTPVLFTSGYTDGDIEVRGLIRPGSAFLQKPVTPEALVRAVERQLDMSG
ncbi:MAG TPA: response regulator, partial [Gemmatimonadales bacterium]